MNRRAAGSFVKFTVGFLTFVSVSLGVTVAVNNIAIAQEARNQQAAAFSALVKQEK